MAGQFILTNGQNRWTNRGLHKRRRILTDDILSLPACQLCLPPHRQTDNGGRYSHPSPPWYSPPLSARSGPDPLGGHCCSSHIGRQTGENPCGLPLTLPPIDRSRPDSLFWWGIAGPVGRRPQRQTRGLELAADH